MAGHTWSWLAWLVALLVLAVPAASLSSSASSSSSSSSTSSTTTTTPSPTIYDPATGSATSIAQKYRYQGCIHEITGLNGTNPGARALQYGTDEILPGAMTVAACLAFCGGSSSGTTYIYAGLEYARECWCGTRVSVLATAAADADCNLPCDGDNTTLCGGNLRLTLYQMPSATPTGAASRQRAGGVAVALAVGAALVRYLF